VRDLYAWRYFFSVVPPELLDIGGGFKTLKVLRHIIRLLSISSTNTVASFGLRLRSVIRNSAPEMIRKHLRHAAGQPLAGGDVQKLVGAVSVGVGA
jgi:hypothetical protein